MKRFSVILLAVALFSGCHLNAANPSEKDAQGIKWMTFEEMQLAQKKKPKKVIIDFYTDWCGWCKKMDKTTFEHPAIEKYMNDIFYAVKFNAESKDPVKFNGKEYSNPNRFHDLAMLLMDNKAGFPTSVYLDEKLSPITPPIASYLDPKQFETIINYLNTESFKRLSFDDYQKEFKGQVQ